MRVTIERRCHSRSTGQAVTSSPEERPADHPDERDVRPRRRRAPSVIDNEVVAISGVVLKTRVLPEATPTRSARGSRSSEMQSAYWMNAQANTHGSGAQGQRRG